MRRIAADRPATRAVDRTRARLAQHSADRDIALVGDDFERQHRNAIAKVGQRQILEHRQRDPAKRGRARRAFDRRDQRVDALPLAPVMEAHRAGDLQIPRRPAQQLAIGPHPPDPDRPAARQRHCKAARIGIADHVARALAAADCGFCFDQVGCPHHAPGNAHRPEYLRDHRPITCRLHRKVAQPRPLARALAEQLLVDRLTDQAS